MRKIESHGPGSRAAPWPPSFPTCSWRRWQPALTAASACPDSGVSLKYGIPARGELVGPAAERAAPNSSALRLPPAHELQASGEVCQRWLVWAPELTAAGSPPWPGVLQRCSIPAGVLQVQGQAASTEPAKV